MEKKKNGRFFTKGERHNPSAIGRQWLAGLLTWGGLLMMLTGGIGVYPTLQDYLAPTDPDSLEFSVTATAPVGVAAVEATVQPQAPFSDVTRLQTEATASTALPPLFLPETEYIIASDTQTAPKPEQFIEENAVPEATPEAAATPQPTPEPTLSPSPTPTPDPASLLPARLEIPAIGLDAPVMQVGWETQEVNGQLVSNWIVPDRFAAGWHVNSAAPGQPGNTVLNGHNNIHGNVFRDLKDLQPGDEVTVYSGEVSLFSIQTLHHYVVTERHILEEMYQPAAVRQQNAQFIMPTSDERLTLVTCWPNTSNTHRLVIVALPAEVMPTPAMGAE